MTTQQKEYTINLINHAKKNNLNPMDLDAVSKSYYKESVKINNMIDSKKGREIIKELCNV